MPTTVVKTIGTGGDYTTLAAWFAACPSDLTAVDQIWQGQLKSQNFDLSGTPLNITGITTDSTRYIELTTETGASFSDNASVQTNALRYNTSNGASISSSSNYASLLTLDVDYTRLSKVQLATTAASSVALALSKRCTVDRCIAEGASGSLGVISTTVGTGQATVTNSLFVQRASGGTKVAAIGGTSLFVNCTFAVPSDKTAATYGPDGSYATATLKNCAVFGVTNAIETANSTFTNTTCRTSAASPPSGFTQIAYDTSTGSGFENITDATRDFRLKSTSAMLDVGTTDSTNAATDIAGTARPSGSAYDIGAWEYVSAGGGPVSAALSGSAATPGSGTQSPVFSIGL